MFSNWLVRFTGGNANDAWILSSFRDDLDFGKRRFGRTNLNTGRIVGHTEVICCPDQ